MALLSELLILTLAAQIMTGPLLIYHFGRFSIVSLFSNLLILPAQPPIMILGALATGLGMVWLPLGQVAGWLVWLPLTWSVWVVEWTARLPYASLDLGTVPWGLVLLLYATLAAGIWWATPTRGDKTKQPRFSLPPMGSPTTRLGLTGVGVVVLLIWLGIWNLPDGRLHVAFLDVGQGDAILVTFPDGRQMLIDGGPSATQLNWRLGQELPFWDRSLDVLVNTHPDADHLGGLVSLLDRYTIAQTVVTDVAGESQLYQEWEQELAEAHLIPTVGQAGMQLSLSNGVIATILSPGPAVRAMDEPNNHSIVLHLQYGHISFLLPGDIEAPLERALATAGLPLTATVLKSPHHGSKTSSSEIFLEAVDPKIVVISVGEDNRFGHPAPEVVEHYIERGLTILRTDEQGTVEFITDGEQLWVETAY
jgi:competence protein ComEC